jgi:hypothetical protein
MSKLNLNLINSFKSVEKQHQLKNIDFKINHQYVLYTYNGDDEDILCDNLINCLEKIPNKYKLLDNHIYCSNCYIIELNSYYIKNNSAVVTNKYKMKFGLVKQTKN